MITVQSSMIASPVRGLTKELSVKVGVGIRRSLGNAEAMRSRPTIVIFFLVGWMAREDNIDNRWKEKESFKRTEPDRAFWLP